MISVYKYAWSAYLGIALAILFDCYFWQWKFWVLVAPLTILVRIAADEGAFK